MQYLADRVHRIYERMHAAARRAGRDPAEITLVAVTKTHPIDVVAQVIEAGVTHLGENRVQEAEQKISGLLHARHHLHWHLIGHLQRNKSRAAVRLVDMVHSLDSVRLAETFNRHVQEEASHEHRRFPVLLQVNVSGEFSKEGFDLAGGLDNHTRLNALLADVEHIIALPHLDVQGLMTIAPFSDNPETARPIFRQLRLLRDFLLQRVPQTNWAHLSMGMTDDFEVAIEEGATVVRVGRAIFGERPT